MHDQLGSAVIFAAIAGLVLYYGVRALMGRPTVQAAEPVTDTDLGDTILTAAEDYAAACDRYATHEARHIDTEWWLHNRNTSGGAR